MRPRLLPPSSVLADASGRRMDGERLQLDRKKAMVAPGSAELDASEASLVALRRAASVDEFCSAPIGAYVSGRAFLFFYPHEELSGYYAWGVPGWEDFDALAPAR